MRIVELFCFHCKKYFEWMGHIKVGDYYRCPFCDKTNVLEGRAIIRPSLAAAMAILLSACAPCPPDPARAALGALVITSTETVSNSAPLRNARTILGVKPCLHFVGFHDPQRWANAVRVFGEPDIVHYVWDQRAQREIARGWDTVVFAKGDETFRPSPFGHDDSNQRDDPAAAERLLTKRTR